MGVKNNILAIGVEITSQKILFFTYYLTNKMLCVHLALSILMSPCNIEFDTLETSLLNSNFSLGIVKVRISVFLKCRVALLFVKILLSSVYTGALNIATGRYK